MAHFTKRHYEALALVMQATYSTDAGDGGGADTWAFIQETLADMLARDNPLFKRDRFNRACEPGANVRARAA